MIIRLWNYTYIMLPRNIFSVVMRIGIIVVHKHQSKCNYSLQLVSHPFFLHRNKRTYILHLPIQDMCPLFDVLFFLMRHFIFDLKYFCSLKIPFNNMAVQKGIWWKRKWMRQFYILFSSIRMLYFCLRCDASLQCHLPDILSDANTRKENTKTEKVFFRHPDIDSSKVDLRIVPLPSVL